MAEGVEYKEALLVFVGFLKSHCQAQLMQILLNQNEHDHYPIHINALELFDTNMLVSTTLLNSPQRLIPVFEEAAVSVQQDYFRSYQPDPSDPNFTLSVKSNCHVRISNLPVCPELTRDRLPKCQDVSTFLAMTGTVIRCTATKLLEYERRYMCTKCNHVFAVRAEFEQRYQIPKPNSCPSPDGCKAIKFKLLEDRTKGPMKCKDYQELKIQEQIQRLDIGTIPRSIWVILEDDLVDKCKPGDDVTVSGVVLRRWQNVYQDAKCEIELVIKASDIIINNDQRSTITMTDQLESEFSAYWNYYEHFPLEARNRILSSFCPQVFGLYLVKLAVSLALIGGVQRIKESGTRIRGESHVLLVGDPGTGKSQFLKYAAKLMPRSVLTTGIGSTSAGLTVTAVKDSGEWQLEAGALVLADGGICCIDEFNSIRENDRTSIHEAMEQQTISVAKAGLVCKLNTRTTILAATNPKGKYDRNESITVNTALGSPLLSRFDIVLVLVDNQDETWDNIISDFILRRKRPYKEEGKKFWSMERMQSYFSYVKLKTPVLTEDSMRILQKYYQVQRSADIRNAARTTIRLLESIIRLAEAHARLMFRDEVTIQDGVIAVCVMEASMQTTALFQGTLNSLYSTFPEDPDEEYYEQATVVLTKLSLPDILKKVTLEYEERKNNPPSRPPNDSTDSFFVNHVNTPRYDSSVNIIEGAKTANGNTGSNQTMLNCSLKVPKILNTQKRKPVNASDTVTWNSHNYNHALLLESESSEPVDEYSLDLNIENVGTTFKQIQNKVIHSDMLNQNVESNLFTDNCTRDTNVNLLRDLNRSVISEQNHKMLNRIDESQQSNEDHMEISARDTSKQGKERSLLDMFELNDDDDDENDSPKLSIDGSQHGLTIPSVQSGHIPSVSVTKNRHISNTLGSRNKQNSSMSFELTNVSNKSSGRENKNSLNRNVFSDLQLGDDEDFDQVDEFEYNPEQDQAKKPIHKKKRTTDSKQRGMFDGVIQTPPELEEENLCTQREIFQLIQNKENDTEKSNLERSDNLELECSQIYQYKEFNKSSNGQVVARKNKSVHSKENQRKQEANDSAFADTLIIASTMRRNHSGYDSFLDCQDKDDDDNDYSFGNIDLSNYTKGHRRYTKGCNNDNNAQSMHHGNDLNGVLRHGDIENNENITDDNLKRKCTEDYGGYSCSAGSGLSALFDSQRKLSDSQMMDEALDTLTQNKSVVNEKTVQEKASDKLKRFKFGKK